MAAANFRALARTLLLANDATMCGNCRLLASGSLNQKSPFSTNKRSLQASGSSTATNPKLSPELETQSSRVLPQIETPDYENGISDFPEAFGASAFKGLETDFPCLSRKCVKINLFCILRHFFN